VTLINKKGCEILGYEEDQILGKSWFENFLPERCRDEVKVIFNGLMSGELGPLEHQPPFPVLCKGGAERRIAFTNAHLKNEKGEIIGTLSSGADVTEREQAEDALRVSLTKYATLFESLPLGVTTSDKEGNIVESNREAERLLGLSREDQVKRQIDGREWRIVRLDGSPMPASEYASVRAMKEDRRVSDVEMGLVKGDGSITWINVTATPIPLAGHGVAIAYSDITERKQVADALRESEERYRKLIEGMLEGVAYCQMLYDDRGHPIDWIYLNVNSNYEKLTGLRDVVGKRVTEAIPGIEKSNPELFEIYGRVASSGKPEVFENEIRLLKTWLKISVFCPEKDHFVATFENITKRKQTEGALKESEMKYRQLVELAQEGIWAIDADANTTYVNPRMAEMLGYTPEEMMERHLFSFMDERGKEIARIGLDRREQGIKEQHDFEFLRKDGQRIYASLETSPMMDEAGNHTGALAVVADITERKRAEEDLRASEARFQSFMSHIPAVAYMIDASDRYLYINKTYEDAFGMKGSDVVGKTVEEVWPAATAAAHRKSDQQVLASDEGVELVEIIPHKGGPREFLTFKFPVPDARGTSKVLGGVSIDITEQRRVEKALRQANKKLNLLGSVTRHDVINQLSVLFAWLEIAKEVARDESVHEHLARVVEAAKIIQRQLEFTAEYQEVGVKHPEWIDLADAVNIGVEGLDKGKVSLNIDLGGVQVFADSMLEKVFHNLVENALRHGEKVKSISISAMETKEGLTIVCEDDGIGIPADDKEKVFLRGFGKNTGFGLYMVREVLDITGIRVRETGVPGKGARFEIAVPSGNYKVSRQKG
jgi:PAS domain S-box-containing protein